MCAIIATFCLGVHFHAAQQKRQWESAPAALNKPPLEANRKIYPYSVIPGGAYTARELALARRVDPVVAAHYSDFGGAVLAKTAAWDSYMYVSYRKANHIYWTRSKRRIPKGEALLTDGINVARTRCGNRLSLNPQQPTLPKEPTDAELDAPEEPALSKLSKPPVFPAEAYVAPVPGLLDGDLPKPKPFASAPGSANPMAELLGSPLTTRVFPPPVAYFPNNSAQSRTNTPVPITNISDLGTPEPGSLYLILLAGPGMLAYCRFARRRG